MDRPEILDTCRQIIDERIPNLFRLYVNQHVAQSCLALSRYVKTTFAGSDASSAGYQVFLANGMEEALSGAVKLARYAANLKYGSPSQGVIVDDGNPRLTSFASVEIPAQEAIPFIPDVELLDPCVSELPEPARFCVLPLLESDANETSRSIENWLKRESRLLIVLATAETLAMCREAANRLTRTLDPDIVVFDESFVNHDVPFSAFAAKRELYKHWNRRGMKLFHSTTYQPNTISSLHFLRCLRARDPVFANSLRSEFDRIQTDFRYRQRLFGSIYNKNLVTLASLAGFATSDLTTEGHYVNIGEKHIFDGVGGVACSVRGHNPPGYVREIGELDSETNDVKAEVAYRLYELTGLSEILPAVSGASAVEAAIKIGLITQAPRRQVIALKGGFGGKTLLSLTGTWKPSLKRGIDPLYPHVTYIDPFRDDAVEQLNEALQSQPAAIIQLEVIQGVGGVRKIPQKVLDFVSRAREEYDCLLFVDEVQTGFFRTGPFLASHSGNLQPDLLTLGKGASDMMFPFAVTLFGDRIAERLGPVGEEYAAQQRRASGYKLGYKTVLNTLRRGETEDWANRIQTAGEQFDAILRQGLKGAVQDVRCYGLLIGIELLKRKWLGRLSPQLCILKMTQDPEFPLLMGFCQYEPHILKFTPPLTVTDEEIEKLCSTITRVLRKPFYRTLPQMLGQTLAAKIKLRH